MSVVPARAHSPRNPRYAGQLGVSDSNILGTTSLVNSFMSDTRARAGLGIGGSRLKSRVVNPFGSGALNRSVAGSTSVSPGNVQSSQAVVTPPQDVQPVTPVETPQTPITPESVNLPAGTYQYLDLIFRIDDEITPDNPFYSLFSSEYARKVG